MLNLLSLFLMLAFQPGQAPAFAHPEIDLKGKLYRAVFAPGPGVLTEADLANVAEPYKSRLTRFLQRRTAFKSRYLGRADDIDQVARDAKRRALEQAIVAMLETADAPERALGFARQAPVEKEWAGLPGGPAAEADYARNLLDHTPDSPLAPFLHLFIAQRERAASEAYAYNNDEKGAAAALERSRQHLALARAAEDPIYALIADDMDRVDHVYLARKAG